MPTATITQTSLHFTAGPPRELHGRTRRRAVPIICPAPAGRETLNEGGHYYDVPSFAVVNAKVSWNVAGRLDVDLSGLNLTDRSYWVVDGYPESGRVVRLSSSWRF
jgi:hypothetical protein